MCSELLARHILLGVGGGPLSLLSQLVGQEPVWSRVKRVSSAITHHGHS